MVRPSFGPFHEEKIMFEKIKSGSVHFTLATLAPLAAFVSASVFMVSFFPALSYANVLSLEPSGKTIENVAIAKSATAKIADRSLHFDTRTWRRA